MTCDTWHVTPDMWHVTCDTWHVTHDMWHVVGGEHSLKMDCDIWCLEDWEENADGLNELINNEGVRRTAPATPGLLITLSIIQIYNFLSFFSLKIWWIFTESVYVICPVLETMFPGGLETCGKRVYSLYWLTKRQ